MKRILEKIYVKVNSDFDSTGYMMPRTITWADGRTFKIDEVKDFRPASTLAKGHSGDCYTVVIRGEEKFLFVPSPKKQTKNAGKKPNEKNDKYNTKLLYPTAFIPRFA